MSLAEMASTREGTAGFEFVDMWPWPPASSIPIVEGPLSDGFLRLTAEPSGQIRVLITEVLGGQEATVFDLSTCPLLMEKPLSVWIAVAWERPDDLTVVANGKFIASTKGTVEVPARLLLQPRKIREPDDLSAQNQRALRRRRDRLMGWQPIPRRIPGTKDDMFRALELEIRQLEDLLAHVAAGRFHHLPGLSSRLRALIATGRPLPLLQMCAAYDDLPLIAYTKPKANNAPEPIAYMLSISLSSVLSAAENTPIDLDVWLDTVAAQIGRNDLSHRDLLKGIGDTVGSHLDQDFLPAVVFLRSNRGRDFNGVSRDMLLAYVAKAAAVTLSLCHSTLSSRSP